MKKLIIFIFFIISGNVKSFSKVRYGIYSCKIAETGCTLELRIGGNGVYNLILTQKMHVSTLIPLSIGYFNLKNDTFYLRDSAASTTFLGVLKKKNFCFLTGYPIMKSYKLKFDKPDTFAVNFINLYIDPDTICNNEKIKSIEFGYFNSVGAGGFHFMSDGTYKVYCNFCAWGAPLEISSGKFIQNDCMLYLYDNYVEKVYRMKLKDKEVVNIDIPFNPGPYFPKE